jgi:alkylresorcinol/alkylpyrone synthase
MSRIVAVAPALPEFAYTQAEITAELSDLITSDRARRAVLERFHAASGIGRGTPCSPGALPRPR